MLKFTAYVNLFSSFSPNNSENKYFFYIGSLIVPVIYIAAAILETGHLSLAFIGTCKMEINGAISKINNNNNFTFAYTP